MSTTKYLLNDTFNARTISSHDTIVAAREAQKRHSAAVKAANGTASYIPTEIKVVEGGVERPMNEREIEAVFA